MALVEELELILEVVRAAVGPLSVVADEHTGRLAYVATRGRHRLLFALVGRGQERSAATAVQVIAGHRPSLTVNVGIAGALSDELSIGDVVLGDQVISYLANAKAVPSADGFAFELAGDPLRSDELLIDRAVQLPFLLPSSVRASRDRMSASLEPELAAIVRQGGYGLTAGAVACGPIVGAAGAFRRGLRGWKRDLIAIDTETSGTAIATAHAGMLRRVRFLALRGISDLADEDKTRLEQTTRGAARRLAVHCSLEVLLLLLDVLPEEIFQ